MYEYQKILYLWGKPATREHVHDSIYEVSKKANNCGNKNQRKQWKNCEKRLKSIKITAKNIKHLSET